MTRFNATAWASVVLGLAVTGSALAQSSPDPDAPTNPSDTGPQNDTTRTSDDDGLDTTNPNTNTLEPTNTNPGDTTIPNDPNQTGDTGVSAQGTIDTTVTPPTVDVDTPPPVVVTTPAPTTVVTYDDDDDDDDYFGRYGIAIAAGGGVSAFTSETLRETTDAGGGWDVRLSVGTRSPIAFEGSYIGSAQAINALGLDNDALLVGNGVQGAIRVNATLDLPVQPFAFAGAAWRHYELSTDTNTSDVNDSDDVLEIPVGVGLAGKVSGLILDVRGELRASAFEDMVPERFDDNIEIDEDSSAGMHRWGVNATLGYEF